MTCSKYWVRPGVTLGRTTIEADEGGVGAFAPMHPAATRGAFLGVYRADYWKPCGKRRYGGRNDYVMEVGEWRAVPKMSGSDGKPDLAKCAMLAIQEPPAGGQANCVFFAFYAARDIGVAGPGGRPIASVAVYAARDLLPGEELFVHYGDGKARDYDVGEPAARLLKKEIAADELPCAWLPGSTRGRHRRVRHLPRRRPQPLCLVHFRRCAKLQARREMLVHPNRFRIAVVTFNQLRSHCDVMSRSAGVSGDA